MNNRFQSDFRRTVVRERCAATVCLMIAAAAIFVLVRLVPQTEDWLLFDPSRGFHHPWTLLTGALGQGDTLSVLFGVAWLWWIGGSLERSFGVRTFLGLWAAVSLATSLALYAGFLLTGHAAPPCLWATLDGMTVVWGLLNRDAVVCVMGLPLRGITLALFSPLFVLVVYALPIGLFALAGCAVGWCFVAYRRHRWRNAGVTRISGRRRIRSEENSGLFGRVQAWRRNRRLARLLRISGAEERDR